MPHRNELIKLLKSYNPIDAKDDYNRQEIIKFVMSNNDCFERANQKGHITGSCWLLNPERNKVLLTHHRKLNKWIQLGGHAEGENDIIAVAIREAQEESGIDGIKCLSENIFDVDIHKIPAYKNDPEHWHYDIRILLMAESENYIVSQESKDLSWKSMEQIFELGSYSLARMATKWLKSLK